MRIPRPWLAVAFRRHKGLGLLDCGPLVRTRLGKRAGVRPHRRLDAPTLSDPNSGRCVSELRRVRCARDLAAVDSAVELQRLRRRSDAGRPFLPLSSCAACCGSVSMSIVERFRWRRSRTQGEFIIGFSDQCERKKKRNGIDLRMNHPPKGERRSRV